MRRIAELGLWLPSALVKPPDFTSGQLVGSWRVRQGAYVCDWVLKSDGTFVADVAEHGITISHVIGGWVIEGTELVSTSTKDEFDLVRPGHQERDVLLVISADYFVLRTRQGIRRKYERIHETKSRATS
jgi:hypothetical protein